MEKALEILKHIEELYVVEPDFGKIERMAQNNPERVKAWQDAFDDYDVTDVLLAIDNFWNYQTSKSRPSVAQIKAKLNAVNAERKKKNADYIPMTDPAVAYMQRDIKLGRCRHLLPVYRAAVRYIAEDILAQEIPVTEWRRMTFAERCTAAMKRGLFNSFDEVMVLICRRNQGKDFQFESGSQIVRRYDARTAVDRGIERVAVHFRTDEAEMAKAAGF